MITRHKFGRERRCLFCGILLRDAAAARSEFCGLIKETGYSWYPLATKTMKPILMAVEDKQVTRG